MMGRGYNGRKLDEAIELLISCALFYWNKIYHFKSLFPDAYTNLLANFPIPLPFSAPHRTPYKAQNEAPHQSLPLTFSYSPGKIGYWPMLFDIKLYWMVLEEFGTKGVVICCGRGAG